MLGDRPGRRWGADRLRANPLAAARRTPRRTAPGPRLPLIGGRRALSECGQVGQQLARVVVPLGDSLDQRPIKNFGQPRGNAVGEFLQRGEARVAIGVPTHPVPLCVDRVRLTTDQQSIERLANQQF